MNPLLGRLASLRRWTRLLEGWRGICVVALVILGAVTAAGLLDWSLHLPSVVRAVVLVATLGGAGFLGYRYLFLPLYKPCDDLTLALRVEERYPELNDALASTVQFLEHGGSSPAAGSTALREHAITQTLERTEQIDFRRILDMRGVYLLSIATLVVAAVAGYFAWQHPGYSRTAVLRLAEPFGGHTWTRLAVNVQNVRGASPDDATNQVLRVAVGQAFVIHAAVEGIIPAAAKLEVDGPARTDKLIPIKREVDGKAGTLIAAIDMTQQRGTFRFRLLANDGSYPPRAGSWQDVEVLPPPKLIDVDGQSSPQIELFPPAYTELPSPKRLPPGTRQLELLAGTNVHLRAAADRPLEEAWLELRPGQPLAALASQLAPLGETQAPALLGQLALGQAVAGRVPAQFEAGSGRTVFSFDFMPWITGTYVFHIQDENGLPWQYHADLTVLPDPVPVIKLSRPSGSMTVLPDAEIAFQFRVEDEFFAVRSVYMEYHRRKQDGQLTDDPLVRMHLYDGPELGRSLPGFLARAARWPGTTPGLKLRPKQLDFATRWPLRNKFKAGETVVVQICADDYCDVFGSRAPGRSVEVELRIVGEFELAKEIDEKLQEVQQQLVRMQKMQQEAAQAVKEMKGKDKITQKEIDRIVEAEQIQNQIRERIGRDPDEGLRNDLGKLQQTLRDNKMTDTEAQEQVRTLKGELDRLAQQELQQLEPQLARAVKELANAEKKDTAPEKKGSEKDPEKKEPGSKKEAGKNSDSLDRAAKLQDSAQKGLDDLVRQMNPWASLQQIKAEAREIHEREKAIKKELEELLSQKKETDQLKLDPNVKADKNALDQLDRMRREQMQKQAEAEATLAKRTEDLIEKMRDVKDKRKDDKETSKRLEDATNVAEKGPLPSKMREVEKDLNEKSLPSQKALQQQDKNLKEMEKVISALDGRKEDVAERLQKQRKEAHDDLEQLTKKMKDLDNKVKEAQKIADPQARKEKLKELAKEHQELKEELDKQARALSRLQEERASNDLDKAAQEVEKMAKHLGDGDVPPENEPRDARDKVEQAKQDFQESEEALARERLLQIADKLKGLKERQDAAVVRSEEFHQRLLAKKFWSDDLADTLGGDALSQQGMAKETRSLKEKVKQAKVFEHILERAADAMDKAAEVMDDRKKEGLADREDPKLARPFEKEELDNETQKHGDTIKYQKQACRRLDNILDALKQEIAKLDEEKDRPKEEKKAPSEKKEGDPEQKQQPRGRPGDGIPSVAQLKALRSEQLDVNEQTKVFAERHPDVTRLNADQRTELQEIQRDQARLMELFTQIVQEQKNAEKGGAQP